MTKVILQSSQACANSANGGKDLALFLETGKSLSRHGGRNRLAMAFISMALLIATGAIVVLALTGSAHADPALMAQTTAEINAAKESESVASVAAGATALSAIAGIAFLDRVFSTKK